MTTPQILTIDPATVSWKHQFNLTCHQNVIGILDREIWLTVPLDSFWSNVIQKVQSLPSSYVVIILIYLPKRQLCAPKCTVVTKKYDSNRVYAQKFSKEIAQLEEISSHKQGDTLPKSKSKSHAERERVKPGVNGINVILTLIHKPVLTFEIRLK